MGTVKETAEKFMQEFNDCIKVEGFFTGKHLTVMELMIYSRGKCWGVESITRTQANEGHIDYFTKWGQAITWESEGV